MYNTTSLRFTFFLRIFVDKLLVEVLVVVSKMVVCVIQLKFIV